MITTSPHRRAASALVAAVAGLALVVAGSAGATTPPSDTATGLASTPADAGADSDGGLPPDPLESTRAVRVGLPLYLEAFDTVLLADAMGEFERENLDVEFVTLPAQDGLPLLGSGDLDLHVTSFNAGVVNAVASGVDIRVIAPLYHESLDDIGLWVRSDLVANAPESLEGARIGSSIGAGSAASAAIDDYLDTAGLTITDIELVQFATADLYQALESGAVDAAWMLTPADYERLEEDGSAVFVTGQAGGQAGGFVFAGPNLLDDEPEVAEAFVRAMARTNRLYLAGEEYKSNDEVVDALAEAVGVDREIILASRGFLHSPDLEIVPSFFERVQEVWLEFGDEVVTIEEPQPFEAYVDTRMIDAVVTSDGTARAG